MTNENIWAGMRKTNTSKMPVEGLLRVNSKGNFAFYSDGHEFYAYGENAADRMIGDMTRNTPVHTVLQKVTPKLLDFARRPFYDPKADANGFAVPHNLFVMGDGGLGKTEEGIRFANAIGYESNFIGSGQAGGSINRLVVATDFSGSSAAQDILTRVESGLENAQLVKERLEELQNAKLLNEDGTLDRSKLSLKQIKAGLEQSEHDASDENVKTVYNAHMAILRQVAVDAGLMEEQESLSGVTKTNGPLLTTLLKAKAEVEKAEERARELEQSDNLSPEEALHQAMTEVVKPKMVMVDEMNRYKETGGVLQNFLEVMKGSRHMPIELQDAQGQKHVFEPKHFGHVFLYATGNDPRKEGAAQQLSDPTRRRWNIVTLDGLSAADYQQRFEQVFAGIAMNPSFIALEGEMDDQEFAEAFLPGRRILGHDDRKKANIPSDHMAHIANSPKLRKATAKLGSLIEQWERAYNDPQTGFTHDANALPGGTPHIGMQTVHDLMQAARMQTDPEASVKERKALRGSGHAPKNLPPVNAENIGTRLCEEIKRTIDETHGMMQDGKLAPKRGQERLMQHMYDLMLEAGVIDIAQYEAIDGFSASQEQRSGSSEPLAPLINVSGLDKFQEHENIRSVLCDLARANYPELKDTPDSAILGDHQAIEAALAGLKESQEQLIKEGKPHQVPLGFLETISPRATIEKQGDRIKTSFAYAPQLEINHLLDLAPLKDQLPAKEYAQLEHSLNGFTASERTQGIQLLAGLALAEPEEIGAALDRLIADTRNDKRLIDRADMKRSDEQGKERAETPEEHKRRIDYLEGPTKALFGERNADGSFVMEVQGDGQEVHKRHPSGLKYGRIDCRKLLEDGSEVLEPIEIVTVRYQTGEGEEAETKHETLIINNGIASAGMLALLQKRGITYIDRNEVGAAADINASLKSIMGHARYNLEKAQPGHPALKEQASEGLYHLLMRGVYQTTDESEREAGGNEKQDWEVPLEELPDLRRSKIVDKLLNPGGERSAATKVFDVSWDELISGKRNQVAKGA